MHFSLNLADMTAGGRPRKLASDQMTAARQMLSNGTPARDVALALGVDRSTLFRALAE